MAEKHTQAEIRLALGRVPGLVLFRQNTGQAWTGEVLERSGDTIVLGNARVLHAGLCKGSSDLVGWRAVTITPDMVGRKVALFTAVEVKGKRTPVTEHQQTFIGNVQAAGGLAGVARSVEDAARIVLLD